MTALSIKQEFDKWEVEYSRPPFTVWVPLICSENLEIRETQICTGKFNFDNEVYQFRNREACALSITSGTYKYTEPMLSYSAKAGKPKSVELRDPRPSAGNNGHNQLFVEWTPNGNITCTNAASEFLRWEVNIRRDGTTSWIDYSECVDATNYETSSCLVKHLASDTEYEIKVKQRCQKSERSSDFVLSNPQK